MMGGEGIRDLLDTIDLVEIFSQLKEDMENTKSVAKTRHLLSVLKLLSHS